MLNKDTEFFEVEKYNDDGWLSKSSAVLIEYKNTLCFFTFVASVVDNSIFYVAIIPTDELLGSSDNNMPIRVFEGQSGSFPIREYNDLLMRISFSDVIEYVDDP